MGLHAPLLIRPKGTRRPIWPGSRLFVPAIFGLIAITGCSQSGSFVQRRGLMGSLKTNVARLESEKDKLTRELAESKTENRRIETQLAEIESQNGELAARLDDARAVMSRQGLDEDRSTRAASDDLGRPKRKSTPAKVIPKANKTPFAQIPSERRDLDNLEDSNSDDLLDSPKFRNNYGNSNRDPGPQSRLNDRSPWLPVARGPASPIRNVK